MTAELLFLCHRIPFPPNKGDKIRSHALLSHLAKRYKVHVGCFIDDPRDWEYTNAVRALAGGECLFLPLTQRQLYIRAAQSLLTGKSITESSYQSTAMKRWITGLKVNQAVVFSAGMAPHLMHSSWNPAQCLLDLVDIDSEKWRQYAKDTSGLKRWLYAREATLLQRLEKNAAQQFGATTLVSPQEKSDFARIAPEAAGTTHAISNGVNATYFSPDISHPSPFAEGETAIVFTGMMDYRPNADAALWFIREILPQVLRTLPHVRFYAVGANPPPELQRYAGENVIVTGRRDDVRPYLQHAAAVTAPLRLGRGVQNKVLEALAMNCPVVATREATQALAVENGTELRIENDPARFAVAITEIAGKPNPQGRRYIQQHHDWQATLAPLDTLLAAIAANPRRLHILYHHRTRAGDGQSVHIDEIIRALREAGHHVTLVEPKRSTSLRTAPSKALLPKPIYELLELAYNLVECIKLNAAIRRARPDAIYERANLYTLSGLWAARWHKLPLLLEVNAPLAQERTQHGGLAFPALARWSEHHVWRKAQRVLPVSRVLATEIQQAGAAPARIVTIPNGIDPSRFTIVDSAKSLLGLEGKLVLGFAGYVREWHGLKHAVSLLAQPEMTQAHLLIAGDGPARPELESLARQYNVSGRITFTGAVAHADITRLIGAMDIALLPDATPYASPLKLFEYMALGRCIVAPDRPNIREILTHGLDAQLFTPEDSASFAKAVIALAGNVSLRAKLGAQAAHTIAERGFTWQQNARRIAELATQCSTEIAYK